MEGHFVWNTYPDLILVSIIELKNLLIFTGLPIPLEGPFIKLNKLSRY